VGPHTKDRTGLGYAGAIVVSALGHAAFLYLVLFALPRWFTSEATPPPAYTVKIVDNLPAGDLGSHLPKLSHHHRTEASDNPQPEEKPPEQNHEKPPPDSGGPKIEASNSDRNALALNITASPVATPAPTETETPTPTPEPTATVVQAAAPTTPPTPQPTARPKRRPRATARPTPRPKPQAQQHRDKHHRGPAPKALPKVMLARVAPLPRPLRTPSIKERLRKVREQLLKEHLQQLAKNARTPPASDDDDNGDDETEAAPAAAHGERSEGGGPVAGDVASKGRGYGIGSGTGSVGILKDPEFLLYYQKVQERIKDAWSFANGSKDLTTTVNFSIGPDGKLTGIEVARSSNNASFDQSVLRAIRRAAPFPAPPQRYRDQFAQGIQAVFKLGELSS
jgi:TonB family protein